MMYPIVSSLLQSKTSRISICRKRVLKLILTCMMLSLQIAVDVNAACPSYVKKTTIEGTRDRLPKGFFCYGAGTAKGIYKSPLNQFSPQSLSGAKDDVARTISISDDGTWLVYGSVSSRKICVIKADGTGRTVVPTAGEIVGTRELVCGILRRGPFGQEIIYKSDNTKIRAIGIEWTGATPKFGTNRIIGSFSTDVRTRISASGNKAFTQLSGVRFITIPDGGKGTAGDGDLWKYSGTNEEGCFTTMSYDGSYCAFNPGFYGDVACIPQEKGGMWHKGFVMTPFMSTNSPTTTMGDLLMTKGVSVNWCPQQYRYGAVWEIDFSHWNFANKNEYIIGIQTGEKTPVHGVWLIHWQTNTWTLLTNNTTRASFPAGHIESNTSATNQLKVGQVLGNAKKQIITNYYDLSGRVSDKSRRQFRVLKSAITL